MTGSATTTLRRTPARADSSPSLRLAAIDVGSNSIHMIVAQADADGAVTTLWRLKEPVGLGRMSFPSHRLSRHAMDAAISVLARFTQAATHRQAEKIIAVATSAVREASNGGDLIERARQELGLNIRVVSARDEARLIYLAVRHAIALKDRLHLIIDIGGGSVEFIVGDGRRAQIMESRKLGAARMTARFVRSDPISKDDLKALRKHYQAELGPLCEQMKNFKPAVAIGTSGTLENIADLCSSSPENGDDAHGENRVIERDRFEKLLEKLLDSDAKQRASMRGLDDQRKEQIIAGALLVDEIFQRFSIRRIRICPAALREGILLDYLSRHIPDLAIRREVPDPRRRSVLDLARRCDWHKSHSEHVTMLCMRLFDELRPLHRLGQLERELIEYSALLHDIGWHISGKGHHKHSMYLIANGDLRDFSDDEVAAIANIARYHRKSPPRKEHVSYTELSAPMRRIVDVGAALLRLADGLDRSHAGVISDLRCKIEDGRKIRGLLDTRGDAELEIWGARRKMDWFEEVFGRKITFEVSKR
jgi:exopolyphosphatase/guanosine-5'-triphosphate,3'-diphosphate pyrophosphatase